MVHFNLSLTLLLGSVLAVLAIPHGSQLEQRLAKRAICNSGIHIGAADGKVYQADLANKSLGSMIYSDKGTSWVGGLAVNTNGVEMKTSAAKVYKGTAADYWTRAQAVEVAGGNNLVASGALPDGKFIYGSPSDKGVAYICDEAMTTTTKITFTNLADNSRQFCKDLLSCILDIAIDGNGYAWVIDFIGYLFISTNSQITNPGGPMKYIGRLPWNYPETDKSIVRSNGIAFDADGNVYYSLVNVNQVNGAWKYTSFVLSASMQTPLATTTAVDRTADIVFGDLASCYFPTA